MATKTIVKTRDQLAVEKFNEGLDLIPEADDSEVDSEDARNQILASIILGEFEDNDALLAGGASTLANFVGDNINILGAVKRMGDFGSFYLQLRVSDTSDFDGREILVSTGSGKVMAKVIKVALDDRFPLKAKVFKGTAKKSGRPFYDLILPE
jgi:hypothetical protein